MPAGINFVVCDAMSSEKNEDKFQTKQQSSLKSLHQTYVTTRPEKNDNLDPKHGSTPHSVYFFQ